MSLISLVTTAWITASLLSADFLLTIEAYRPVVCARFERWSTFLKKSYRDSLVFVPTYRRILGVFRARRVARAKWHTASVVALMRGMSGNPTCTLTCCTHRADVCIVVDFSRSRAIL
jgi:hypothetical protein